MEVVFVFSKKDFTLIFKFIQPRKAFASRQPTDFDIKQKFHMLHSYFFGRKLEKPVIFFLERMKLIILTATSITSIKCRGRLFDARMYRCSEQCEDVTCGSSFFTSVINPDMTPIIAGVQSLQMRLKFYQLSLLASKKESTRALTSVAVVVADSVLLNKNSSFIFLFFSYRAKAIKWLSKALSVDSSS